MCVGSCVQMNGMWESMIEVVEAYIEGLRCADTLHLFVAAIIHLIDRGALCWATDFHQIFILSHT